MGSDLGPRFRQVDMLIDVFDPGDGDEVMMVAVGRTLFRKLDLIGAVEMVDLADRLLVRRDDVHVFFNLRSIAILDSRECGYKELTTAIKVAVALTAGVPGAQR